ncbi:hypothetical protein SAMN05660199_04643 [Klenkia soli]|uniref:Uncharacterized protein n=1 Tax=Klenkia soli TaxID=1052260 RepID=A0A1H0UUH8_9ACTN|nr:hypothetical protein [Klenkia soli]SDP69745.1 hypothetical protein SAMN05660199_04643 [Klenkia soli]
MSTRPATDAPETRPALLRRAADRAGRSWPDTRGLLLSSLAAPVRPITATVRVLGALVVVAELVGLLARRACAAGGCGPTAAAWATRLDMDALGSVPRALITLVLAAVALVCLRGARVAGRGGAVVWWAVLAAGCALLAAAKHWSVHSLLEERLAPLLPGTDIQLLFVVVSVVGLLVVVVSGRWVRRETRTVVTTWLALYAVAAVGLAAVTLVLARLGSLAADVATLVEETGEGLTAVGLLAVVLASTRQLAARR